MRADVEIHVEEKKAKMAGEQLPSIETNLARWSDLDTDEKLDALLSAIKVLMPSVKFQIKREKEKDDDKRKEIEDKKREKNKDD